MPVGMDRVRLEWGGGDPVMLARIRDGQGCCWLSSMEVHKKLGSNTDRGTWRKYTHSGRHMS